MNAYDAYGEAVRETAPRTQYPALVWTGVAALCTLAQAAAEHGQIEDRCKLLLRAQDIVSAMDHAFEDERLPKVAPALHAWYGRILHLLESANLTMSVELIKEAKEEALTLSDMWEKAASRMGGTAVVADRQ